MSRPNLGRNGFDVSQRRIFSCPAGMLLPTYKDFANPGDKYKINSQTFIRTEAVETAAFMRLKHHLDWFFVPITQIYNFWNEFFNSTNDIMTNFVDSLSTNNSFVLPTSPIYGLINNLTNWVQKIGDDSVLDSDNFGIPKIWKALRLMDMLGYGSAYHNNVITGNVINANDRWFPMYYLAYHKIFHSHYLNTDYFRVDNSEFNVDSYYGSSIPSDVMLKILSDIHYRPYRKDYFTSQKPAPVFNSAWQNSISLSPMLSSSWQGGPGFGHISQDSINGNSIGISSTSSFTQNASASTQNPQMPYVGSSPSVQIATGSNSSGMTTVGNIRAMFALDRLLRITASSKTHYADQILAHFGVSIPEGLKDEAYFLGSQITDIVINEVVATASTDPSQAGGVLGDIAGKGFGSTSPSKDINFTCPCHGIIMAISSIEPLADYASVRPDIDNRYLNSFDFYHPELDNLGMQPLWDYGAYNNMVGTPTPAVFSNPIGWQPRHMELKTKYDVVNESMIVGHRESWVGYKQSLYFDSMPAGAAVQPFTIFYIAPQYTNNIFLMSVPYYSTSVLANAYKMTDQVVTGGVWIDKTFLADCYASDNFLVNMDMRVYKTSCMSVHSLPKYI